MGKTQSDPECGILFTNPLHHSRECRRCNKPRRRAHDDMVRVIHDIAKRHRIDVTKLDTVSGNRIYKEFLDETRTLGWEIPSKIPDLR